MSNMNLIAILRYAVGFTRVKEKIVNNRAIATYAVFASARYIKYKMYLFLMYYKRNATTPIVINRVKLIIICPNVE